MFIEISFSTRVESNKIVIERVMMKIDNVDESNFSMSSEKHLKLVFDSFKNVFKKSNTSVAMQFHGI